MPPIRLTPAHRMLASAVLVGVVIVGGASVTAAAFAGRLDKDATVGDTPNTGRVTPADRGPTGVGGPAPSPGADPDVVSKEFGGDPGDTAGFWTDERVRDAEPMPIPEVSINVITPGD